MAFYEDMQAMARDLLAPTSQGGLGQGEIVLTRNVPGTPDEDQPWLPVEGSQKSETLDGAVRGVDSRLVGTEAGSAVIVSSDRQAICAVPDMDYRAGDTLSVDGTPVTVISVEKIPAAGVTAAIRFIIRN